VDQNNRSKKYALRIKSFQYDDEYHNLYDGDSRLIGIFNDLDEATKVWHELEHKTIKNRPLHNIQDFFERPLAQLEAFDLYVYERCGEHIIDDEWVNEDCEQVVAKMNSKDVFDFVHMADIHSYTLVEYDESLPIFVRWLPHLQAYHAANGENGGRALFSAHTPQALIEQFAQDTDNECSKDKVSSTWIFNGPLDEISHSPVLLMSALSDENLDAMYDQETQVLTINTWDADTAKAIYPLLKKPLFEVHEISVEKFEALQKELEKEKRA